MMLFTVYAYDHPEKSKQRLECYDSHKAHISSASTYGVNLLVGGPLLSNANEEKVIGSFLLFQADHSSDVKRFVDADPLNKNNVWMEVSIDRFDQRSGSLSVEK